MSLTVTDEWADRLCGGGPGYEATVREIQREIAISLGICSEENCPAADLAQVKVDDLRASLDCDADHQDESIQGNTVNLDISDEYAHNLCDTTSPEFQQFKRTFQEQIATSINGACAGNPACDLACQAACPTQGEVGWMEPGDIVVEDESILNNAHCTEMAMNSMPAAGPTGKEVDDAAAAADSSGFDLAVIVLVVACVGMGYRQKTKGSKVKYQAVNADEEIALTDGEFNVDGPSDGLDRDRRENPSFAGQFGSARIGSGKRR